MGDARHMNPMSPRQSGFIFTCDSARKLHGDHPVASQPRSTERSQDGVDGIAMLRSGVNLERVIDRVNADRITTAVDQYVDTVGKQDVTRTSNPAARPPGGLSWSGFGPKRRLSDNAKERERHRAVV